MSDIAATDPTPAANAEGPRRREFAILLSKMDHVQGALDAINKRATKKGLPLVEYVWGAPYEETFTEYAKDDPYQLGKGRKVTIARIPLTITGEKPSYGGWTFVATLEHLDGENVVRTVPGEILPPAFRHRGPVCDHCRLARRRIDTYVVRHEDGRFLQVGRTCIQDFLGSAKAENVANYAQYLADAADAAEDGENEGGGGRRETVFTMIGYLAVVAAFVRIVGWLSRTVAREKQERGEGGGGATADMAWMWLDSPRYRQQLREDGVDIEITEADRAEAEAAVAWAEGLTDAQIDAERGDYLHNLRAVVRSGMVRSRVSGIAASLITAHQRAMGQERKRTAKAVEPRLDAYVGTVGERKLWTLTLDHVTGWQGTYGYTTLLKFKTPEGADVTWKASGVPRLPDTTDAEGATVFGKEISAADVGKTYTVLGTVKKHEEYKGRKQTQLARCELHEGVWAPPAKAKKASKPKSAEDREATRIAKEANVILDAIYARAMQLSIDAPIHGGWMAWNIAATKMIDEASPVGNMRARILFVSGFHGTKKFTPAMIKESHERGQLPWPFPAAPATDEPVPPALTGAIAGRTVE